MNSARAICTAKLVRQPRAPFSRASAEGTEVGGHHAHWTGGVGTAWRGWYLIW